MISVELTLDHNQLCTVAETEIVQCWQVVRGSHETPTPVGVFKIQSITPSSKYISPWIIEFLNTSSGDYVIHSWNSTLQSSDTSKGCIRMNPEDLEELIQGYLFNSLTIHKTKAHIK